MKFDITVNVDREEVSGVLETTQALLMISNMFGIDVNSEYVENLDGTYEFRYKFKLTKKILEEIQNQNNFNISEFFS